MEEHYHIASALLGEHLVREEPLRTAQIYLRADCLTRRGDSRAARACLQDFVRERPNDTSLCLAMANSYRAEKIDDESEELRLRWINRIYEHSGLVPLQKKNSAASLEFGNLATPSYRGKLEAVASPSVSVVIPSYNCASTIEYALQSVQAQTLRDIEIIIVDDCSSDGTMGVLAQLASTDPRIKIVSQRENTGAYGARNRGLREARGKYVTVHDTDDWSHPQKLQQQFEQLEGGGSVANLSSWARASYDMHFIGNWRPSNLLIGTNHSSLMLTTELAKKVGGWDYVRVGGDNEFILRLRANFGTDSVSDVLKSVPLSFSLVRRESLTRATSTHVKTFFHGVINDYRQAYGRWHKAAVDANELAEEPVSEGRRKFPAPPSILSERTDYPSFDKVFVGDFAEGATELDTSIALMKFELSGGRKIGVFHWPDLRLPANRQIDVTVARLLDDFAVTQVSAFQEVRSKVLAVCDPSLVVNAVDGLPRFDFEALSVHQPQRGIPDSNDDDLLNHEDIERALSQGRSIISRMNSRSMASQHLTVYSEKAISELRNEFGSGHEKNHNEAIKRLIKEADEALSRGPYSVTDKPSLPPSGDLHDYFHVAPYWWPDPKTKDGLPYVRRDGHRVPGTELYESGSDRYDRTRLQRLFDDVTILALAWAVTRDERYEVHAGQLVRNWFVTPNTRMNPHLRYAQVRPGHGEGSRTGVIEMKDFYYFLDAIRLLKRSKAFTSSDVRVFDDWLIEYLSWLLTSRQGRQEREAVNNHGTCYDLQVCAIAAYLGDEALLRTTLQESIARILKQVTPEGEQIHELQRSTTAHYCCFNLQSWANLATLADRFGIDLWHHSDVDNRGLRVTFEWLLRFKEKWTWSQQGHFDERRFVPLRYTYLSKYEKIRPLRLLEQNPMFHPHDGMKPFWILGSELDGGKT